MGKIYECDKPNYRIPTDNGVIEFTPVRDVFEDKFYGQFDSETKHIQAAVRIVEEDPKTKKEKSRPSTAEELEVIVEGLKTYQDYVKAKDIAVKAGRAITFKGIWLKKDRTDELKKRLGAIEPGSPYARLSDEELKALIEAKQGKVPANATHDRLVQIVEETAK